MDENDYEIPIAFSANYSAKTPSLSLHSSNEDFVDVHDLPRCASEKNLAMHPRYMSTNQTNFNHAPSPQTLKIPRNLSVDGFSNLRRSVSFASCQRNRINQDKFHSSSNLNRKHSFAYVVSVTEQGKPDFSPYLSNLKSKPQGCFTGNSSRRNTTSQLELNLVRKHRNQESEAMIRSQSFGSSALNRVNLRDSVMDLVTDNNDKEAYTAISLAGTLTSRTGIKMTPTIIRHKSRKLYIIIAILTGIILLLGGLGVGLALALFK